MERFWSYYKNFKYQKAENIKDFFSRIYSKLDEIKSEYRNINVLLVTHGGISIPVNCYFNGFPTEDNLLSLVLNNCEVASYVF